MARKAQQHAEAPQEVEQVHVQQPQGEPTQVTDTSQVTEVKDTKSIVPAKYAGRYKNGGEDPLALFIKEQCTTQEGFNFDKFFELCARNGVAQDKVDHYRNQVAEKRHGAEGRARMTLRNMVATFVRKNNAVTTLSGEQVALTLPKAALTGAAKAAQERLGETTPA
jgi:hypothetical protein